MYKNKLQEHYQKQKLPLPLYNTIRSGGTDHAPLWISTITLQESGKQIIGEINNTKSKAEESAAAIALRTLTYSKPDIGISNRSMLFNDLVNKSSNNINVSQTDDDDMVYEKLINLMFDDNKENSKQSLIPSQTLVPSQEIQISQLQQQIAQLQTQIAQTSQDVVTSSSDSESSDSNSVGQYLESLNQLIVPTENKNIEQRIVLLVDVENMPNFINILPHDGNIVIYAFVGEHNHLVDKKFNKKVIKVISPSTRPDGTDTCMQVYTGMLLVKELFDIYYIATRDHFGSTLVEMIQCENLGWTPKVAKQVSKVCHIYS